MNKTPNKLTDSELLKLLDNVEDDNTEVNFDSSVLAFAQAFRINPGKDKVVKKQLYRLYKAWNKGIKKLSQQAFTVELSYLVDHNASFFLIDQNMFDIAKFVEDEKTKRKIHKNKSKAWHQHFTAFLNDTKLEEGQIWVELEILYFLYLQWRNYARKKASVSKRQFIKILDLYFDVKTIAAGDNLWVGVNDQIYNLITKQEVDRWRKHRDKETKRFFYPKEEWRKFALYWEEKSK